MKPFPQPATRSPKTSYCATDAVRDHLAVSQGLARLLTLSLASLGSQSLRFADRQRLRRLLARLTTAVNQTNGVLAHQEPGAKSSHAFPSHPL